MIPVDDAGIIFCQPFPRAFAVLARRQTPAVSAVLNDDVFSLAFDLDQSATDATRMLVIITRGFWL